MILWVRNLGRTKLGHSLVPCDASWNHSCSCIYLRAWLELGHPRWPHNLQNLPPCGLQEFSSFAWTSFQHGSWVQRRSNKECYVPKICSPKSQNINSTTSCGQNKSQTLSRFRKRGTESLHYVRSDMHEQEWQ